MDPDRRLGEAIRSASELAREEQIPAIAAGLAYHESNSLIPFAVLLLVGLSAAGELQPALAELQTLTGVGSTNRLIEGLGTACKGRFRAAVIAHLILVWSAVR